MHRIYISIGAVLLLLVASAASGEEVYDYGTRSDAAREAYHRGWSQIMDDGLWAEAERSFRQAVDIDPDFLIGKSLVARISPDLAERIRLQQEIESRRADIDDAGRLLLDVFLLNIHAMNLREQGQAPDAQFNSNREIVAVRNFAAFLEEYPTDTYTLAEYVEWIHRVKGAEAALDVMRQSLAPGKNASVPFFKRYAASLNAELGNFDEALIQAREFAEMLNDPDLPEQYVLFAEIFHLLGHQDDARRNIAKAVELDSRHLIARSLHSRINAELLE